MLGLNFNLPTALSAYRLEWTFTQKNQIRNIVTFPASLASQISTNCVRHFISNHLQWMHCWSILLLWIFVSNVRFRWETEFFFKFIWSDWNAIWWNNIACVHTYAEPHICEYCLNSLESAHTAYVLDHPFKFAKSLTRLQTTNGLTNVSWTHVCRKFVEMIQASHLHAVRSKFFFQFLRKNPP